MNLNEPVPNHKDDTPETDADKRVTFKDAFTRRYNNGKKPTAASRVLTWVVTLSIVVLVLACTANLTFRMVSSIFEGL